MLGSFTALPTVTEVDGIDEVWPIVARRSRDKGVWRRESKRMSIGRDDKQVTRCFAEVRQSISGRPCLSQKRETHTGPARQWTRELLLRHVSDTSMTGCNAHGKWQLEHPDVGACPVAFLGDATHSEVKLSSDRCGSTSSVIAASSRVKLKVHHALALLAALEG